MNGFTYAINVKDVLFIKDVREIRCIECLDNLLIVTFSTDNNFKLTTSFDSDKEAQEAYQYLINKNI